MIKILQETVIEGTYLNIIKAIYDKPTESPILNGEKLIHIFQIRNKTRVPIHTTITQYSSKSPSQGNQRTKSLKRNPDWKEGVKLSLLTDDIKLYIENPKVAPENYQS